MANHNCGPLYPYQGESLNLHQIGIRCGIASSTLSKRIRRGMTLEQAIAAPDGRKRATVGRLCSPLGK